ncbi:MAG: hypothetical protein ACRD23_07695 [Terriglobales bacterium]
MSDSSTILPSTAVAFDQDAVDAELRVMMKVSEALGSLKDAGARERVLFWVASKFQCASGLPVSPPAQNETKTESLAASAREIPGIARLSDTGELHLTVRDMKARSANDAALRIAHIVIYANQQLTGSETVSSKKTLLPILRKYRAYDGNTRSALAQHRGFVREGDQLSMDFHCKKEAEGFVREILDSTTQGTWAPSARASKKKVASDKASSVVQIPS